MRTNRWISLHASRLFYIDIPIVDFKWFIKHIKLHQVDKLVTVKCLTEEVEGVNATRWGLIADDLV